MKGIPEDLGGTDGSKYIADMLLLPVGISALFCPEVRPR